MLVEDWFDNLLDSSEEEKSVQAITSIKSVEHGISLIADLNETAIEYIEKELYEEAGESLLHAFEAIPKIEKLREKSSKPDAIKFDYSYFCTIYYNIAWVYQKLSGLEDCREFLEKWLTWMTKLDLYKYIQNDSNIKRDNDLG